MLKRRAVLASASAALARPGRAAGRWSIVTEYPATAISGEGVAAFATAATRLTHGQLVVTPSFEGIRSAAMPAAVSEGQVDAADAFTGGLAAEAPILQLSSLPFLTADAADTAKLLGLAREAYQAALGRRGLTLLYATPWPATGIWSRVALTGAGALTNLRIRTYDAASTRIFEAAGAAPRQVSFADAMPLLRSGALDAVLSSGDGGAGAKLWEILPNFTVLNYAFPLSLAFCRTRALSELPPDVQGAIGLAARETEARQFMAMATRAEENRTRMQQNGVVLATEPAFRPQLVAAAAPVIAEWQSRAGAAGSAVLAAYR